MSEKRAAAERRGRAAEWVALFFLMAKGYRILGRRIRTPYGEVDVAAFKRGMLIVAEVKARASLAAGVFAVSDRQQHRLVMAGRDLARRWRLGSVPIRFDILVVHGLRVLTHRRNAFGAREADHS